MKHYYLLLMLTSGLSLNAQVGINTILPNASLEVAASAKDITIADGIIAPKLTGLELKEKDNTYSNQQQGSIIYVTNGLEPNNTSTKTVNVIKDGYYYFDGSIWQTFKGTPAKDGFSQVFVKNGLTRVEDDILLGGTLDRVTTIHTSNENTLRLSGLVDGNVSEKGKVLMIDSLGNVQRTNTLRSDLSIPSPSIFRLSKTADKLLFNMSIGNKQVIPNMEMIKNTIRDLTYNQTTGTISLPAGIYQMMFVYEGTNDYSECTISSYFMDFPTDRNIQRIHSTAAHKAGVASNHGGTINYTTVLSRSKDWQIELGRGQSGNCHQESIISLAAESTHLLIFRIGDPN